MRIHRLRVTPVCLMRMLADLLEITALDAALSFHDARVHLVALGQWRLSLGCPMVDTLQTFHRDRISEGIHGTRATVGGKAAVFQLRAFWPLVRGSHTGQLWTDL